ncbi:MAG: sulfotransferase family protein [Saprospiraceae bacterium]|nr:sulfotransferase family protein [Saprospiraceae bacterium]
MSRIRHQLELISIHIPKTAGTSFQQILEAQYPGKALMRMDFEYVRLDDTAPVLRAKNKTDQAVLDQLVQSGEIPAYVKALHGHFTLPDIQQFLSASSSVRLVTWLRQPIERVISNYNYLNELLEVEILDRPRAQRLVKRLKRTIYEFASLPVNADKYQIYLGGHQLDAFDFVGLTDHFDEDIIQLAKMMDWHVPRSVHVNKTPRKSFGFNTTEQEVLEELYQLDIDIYQAAVERRKERVK